MRLLFEDITVPLSRPGAPGSWLKGRRVVAIDGTLFDIPDTDENLAEYRKAEPSSPFPRIRAVGLGECGTRAIIAAEIGTFGDGERVLAARVADSVDSDMLVTADRGFFSFDLWARYLVTGADLLWRVKKDLTLDVVETFRDGSYLSVIRSTSTQGGKRRFEIPLSVRGRSP